MGRIACFLVFCVALCCCVSAGTISITGSITQSTGDGTGPAVNNPSLNKIVDGDAYSILLDLTGSSVSAINAPGVYNLTGGALTFSDPSAPSTEASFASIVLVVSNAGAVDDLTLLGCLTTGTACNQGNQLSASFEIPAASLTALNVATTGLDQPHPLDLLEDDGVTDIHGSITRFSNSTSASVPEPGAGAILIASLVLLAAIRRKMTNQPF